MLFRLFHVWFKIPGRNEETLLLMRGASPDRIGHGTFMHPDVGGTDEIMQEVLTQIIPIGKVPTVHVYSVNVGNFPFNPLLLRGMFVIQPKNTNCTIS